jgi:hypothetical protein
MRKLDVRLHALMAPALLAGALLAGATAAMAQDVPPIGVRGAITAVDGDLLKIHTTRGEDLTVGLTKSTQVRGVTLANISDVVPGSYIGSAATPQPDGTLKALEIHVFPPDMRGAGEGHRAWDLGKNGTMTNGTIGDLVVSNGRTITVRYKSGEKKIVIPENVPIVKLEAGDRSLLVPGTKIVLFAKKDAASKLSALFISAGKNGITPPM